MTRFRIFGSVIGAVLLTAGSALAASQGTLTTGTSEATSDIDITIPKMVKITGVQDIGYTVDSDHLHNGYTEAETKKDVCVYSNHATGKYKVRFVCTEGTGAGTDCADDYKLQSSASKEILYVPYWQNTKGAGSGTAPASYGQELQGDAANTTTEGCTDLGGNSAALAITIANTELQKVPAGKYEGTLHIQVYPDSAG